MIQDPERTDPRLPPRTHAWILLILCVVPPALVLARQAQFGLPFPYWDEWRFAEILQKYMAGKAGFVDFWSQHNEHRILFPRLMMLALARLSGWNMAWELAASVVLATASYSALLVLFLRKELRLDFTLRCAAAALCSALVFSWTQNENWVWGFQSNVWLMIASVTCGVSVLSSGLSYRVRIGLGVIAGLIATYSYANGIFFWLAALPLIWDLRVPSEQRAAGLVVWGIAAGLVAESYFYDYVKPSVSPSLFTAFEHPLLFAGYLAALLGAPVSTFMTMPAWHGVDAPTPMWALLPGPLAVLAFVALGGRCWLRERDWTALAPWISLATFSLGSAVVASAGRCGFGLGQALTSRYITITTPLWIALMALALRAIADLPQWRKARARSLAVGVMALLVLASISGGSTTSANLEQLCHWKRMGWLAIRAGYGHPFFLGDISDTPDELAMNLLPWLAENKLCGLGTPLENPPQYAPAFLQDARQLMSMHLVPQAKIFLDVAARLDPKCPGLEETRQALFEVSAPAPSPK